MQSATPSSEPFNCWGFPEVRRETKQSSSRGGRDWSYFMNHLSQNYFSLMPGLAYGIGIIPFVYKDHTVNVVTTNNSIPHSFPISNLYFSQCLLRGHGSAPPGVIPDWIFRSPAHSYWNFTGSSLSEQLRRWIFLSSLICHSNTTGGRESWLHSFSSNHFPFYLHFFYIYIFLFENFVFYFLFLFACYPQQGLSCQYSAL